MRHRLPYLLLAVVLVVSFGLNARIAASPDLVQQSADERAYGKLAVGLANGYRYGWDSKKPLHYSPGAPAVFAVTYKLFGGTSDQTTGWDIRAVYWQQALVTTGTTALVAILAWIMAGPWAGVVAGALVATYPALVRATGEMQSEPLGAFLLVAAFTVLALASRRRSRWWVWTLAGGVFALAVLARTNLLPIPFLISAAGVLLVLVQRRALRAAFQTWGMVGVGAAVALAPWTLYASNIEGSFVPVTKGSASTLFIGTYLPAGGRTAVMKQKLEPQLRERYPQYANKGISKISSARVLDMVAEQYPRLSRDDALRRAARSNIKRYAVGRPAAFARMQWSKATRMWMSPTGLGAYRSPTQIVWHILLVFTSGIGLLLGLIRRRDPILGSILLAVAATTLIHTVMVSQPRYNLPLMPTLIAGGVAGWFLATRREPSSDPVAAAPPLAGTGPLKDTARRAPAAS